MSKTQGTTEHNDFDDILKDKLSNLGESDSPSDWDAFSKILAQEPDFPSNSVEQDTDDEFDEDIAEIFKKRSTSFNSAHWTLLKDRLDREAHLKKHIFTIKGIELLLVVLLLFTCFNLNLYHLTFKTATSIADQSTTKVKQGPSELSFATLGFIPTRIPNLAIANAKLQTTAVSNTFVTSQGSQKGQSILAVDSQIFNLPLEAISNEAPTTATPLIASSTATKSIPQLPSYQSTINSLREDVEIDMPYEYLPTPDLKSSTKSLAMNSRVGSSLFYAAEGVGLDRIHVTPEANISIEILKSWRKKNWAWGTGIRYSSIHNNVKHNTDSYEEVDGNVYRINLQKQTYQVASVPIYGTYFSNSDPKSSSFFVSAGIDNNFIMRSDYQTDRDLIARGSQATPGRNPIVNGASKTFEEGIEQGGRFTDNMYMSANLTLGYQFRVNEITSFVTGINYSRYLFVNGLGPNDDKYDILSASLGFKFDLPM